MTKTVLAITPARNSFAAGAHRYSGSYNSGVGQGARLDAVDELRIMSGLRSETRFC